MTESIDPADQEIMKAVRERLAAASRVTVLTGAGISAESGVPTFRGGGQTAVWNGLPATTLSSVDFMRTNLRENWEWFEYRRALIKRCTPNEGHRALAKWERRFLDFMLITQNVDGLHQSAGTSNLVELHGNLWWAQCLACRREEHLPETPLASLPPLCTRCGKRLRPKVVLFGEKLDPQNLLKASQAATAAQVFFIIGTSAVVYPAAELPLKARRAGAFVVEVNPEETEMSKIAHAVLRGPASKFLRGLYSESVTS